VIAGASQRDSGKRSSGCKASGLRHPGTRNPALFPAQGQIGRTEGNPRKAPMALKRQEKRCRAVQDSNLRPPACKD